MIAVVVALLAAGGAFAVVRDRGPHFVRFDVPSARAGPDSWSRWPDVPGGLGINAMVVSTGAGLFVWGGYGDGFTDASTYFDVTARQWRRVPRAPLNESWGQAVAVWTGREVVVVSGADHNVKAAAFEPVSFTWRSLPDPPIDHIRIGMSRVLDVDGRVVIAGDGGRGAQVTRLDEAAGTWHTSTLPLPGLDYLDAVAAGPDVILAVRYQGPGCVPMRVLAYHVDADAWRDLSPGPASDRRWPVMAWTGSQLFVGGGQMCADRYGDPVNTADLLDPTTGIWRPAAGAPNPFMSGVQHSEAWTGHSVFAVAFDGPPVLYDPVTDTWRRGANLLAAGQRFVLPNTPSASLGDTIVIPGGLLSDNGEITGVAGTYVYTLPAGY